MPESEAERRLRWKKQAAAKGAIVPDEFEVFPDHVIIVCGNCRHKFVRTLIPRVNDPTFVCPNESCRSKNWVPVKFELDR